MEQHNLIQEGNISSNVARQQNANIKPPIFTEFQFKLIFGLLGTALASGMTVGVIKIMGSLFLNKSA
ncbi:transmembrane protein, putative (macronuclear) [Tetrahymena thermophila SB210]|uniref:Transmembrane protein, putative n=1 Tax=Tetrahymena thermophila (strain SB210) TaxID=312017 RepID=Q22RA4_TETTS|nr:transmembrane protein, putative [Tetrahymena thermophila SB210]EAR88218.1 transmembrane protein, putative [Tetrahymena thermophila SB210]|eukprot:XP_001008463.1 transmembrane protein, putative [Tetrahymena thermophila SB210]